MTATAASPPAKPFVCGLAVAIPCAPIVTFPVAVSAPPVTLASTVPSISTFDFAPAPAAPMLAESADTNVSLVMFVFAFAFTAMSPLCAVTVELAMDALTVSFTVLFVTATPMAMPTSPPASELPSMFALIVAVLPAARLTPVLEFTRAEPSMDAVVEPEIVLFAVAAPPLSARPASEKEPAAAAATDFAVMVASSFAVNVMAPSEVLKFAAFLIEAAIWFAMLFSESATPIASDTLASGANETAIAAARTSDVICAVSFAEIVRLFAWTSVAPVPST